jgi:hypothetical protein
VVLREWEDRFVDAACGAAAGGVGLNGSGAGKPVLAAARENGNDPVRNRREVVPAPSVESVAEPERLGTMIRAAMLNTLRVAVS